MHHAAMPQAATREGGSLQRLAVTDDASERARARVWWLPQAVGLSLLARALLQVGQLGPAPPRILRGARIMRAPESAELPEVLLSQLRDLLRGKRIDRTTAFAA